MELKRCYVISHTHWDREWYMPLEQMRLRLVDLLDHALTLLETEPTYIFHLDAQTIVLEDYLSICIDKRPMLERFIREGRLLVGPWYLQNDFYLTDGEATVRNLLEGMRMANAFGGCARTGYCADQFGLISQLPQILRGFGIDNCVFGRGAARVEPDAQGDLKRVAFPSEFIWRGADGSTVTAIHLSHWYNNAQRFSADIDKAERMVRKVIDSFEGIAATPYLLLMNGVDHLEAQEDLLPILRAVDTRLDDDAHIFQSTMDQYIGDIKAYIAENDFALYEHVGELRGGADDELLKGTLSSRIYLKQRNVSMQERLVSVLEPLYAILERAGMDGVYSLDHFRYMWRELMKNHAHDSICGCSCDGVHAHMEDNYVRLEEMSTDMLNRALALAAAHTGAEDPEEYGLLAVNMAQTAQNAVLYATLDFPVDEKMSGFTINDSKGKPAQWTLLSQRRAVRDIFSPVNLPGVMDVDRYEIALYAEQLAPLSIRNYKIRRANDEQTLFVPEPPVEYRVIENEFLQVTADEFGAITVLDKTGGRRVVDAFRWEDSADAGDSYVYTPGGDAALYGDRFPARVQVARPDTFTRTLIVERTLTLPARYDFTNGRRAEETVDCPVELKLTVRQGHPVLTLEYMIDNQAEDHRLRLLVQTGLSAPVSLSDSPYDLIARDDNGHYFSSCHRVYPNTSLCAIESGGLRTAVFTCGQHDYEHLRPEGSDILALTLLRCTGSIYRGPAGAGHGDQWLCPENQCLRRVTGRMGFQMQTDGCTAALPAQAKAFRNPPVAYFYACDSCKFSGGRPAVQDSAIVELFYRPDPYPRARIVSDHSAFHLQGDGITVTAFKKAENGHGHIVRLVNLNGEPARAFLAAAGKIFRCRLDESADTLLGEEQVSIEFGAKEIVTVCLT